MNNKQTNNELLLLKKAVAGLVSRPYPVVPMGVTELNQLGLVYAQLGPEGYTGFLPESASAVSSWASLLHRQEERYHRGAEFESLRVALAKLIFPFCGMESNALCVNDVVSIKTNLANWFVKESVCRKYFIPCTIIPYDAEPFTMGPVQFIHANKFWAERLNPNTFSDSLYEDFILALGERHGCWVAIVDVDGADKKRSSELADLATDIALCALHLVMPPHISQRMARINGRTWPAWSCCLHTTDQAPNFNFSNAQPGRAMMPDTFKQLITLQQPILDSVGSRISSFLNLNTPMNKLEQSWCDAAYWFHEALAEPMDTISLAKFETTIEILLAAGSSKQSATRIRLAFWAFLELKDDDVLIEGSSETVKSFSKKLVESRSRVLHGTWSTLMNEMSVSRQDIATLTFLFVRAFTLNLDHYLDVCPESVNSVNDFLDWVAEKRESASATIPS